MAKIRRFGDLRRLYTNMARVYDSYRNSN